MYKPCSLASKRALLSVFALTLPWLCEAQIPTSIRVVSGSNQTARLGGTFSDPVVVSVTDSSNSPVRGVGVTFSGSGIATTTAITGSDGNASATITANSMLGGYTVSADVSFSVSNPVTLATLEVFSLTTVFPLNNADAPCSPTISVTNAGDSTSGSLRQALADVCPGGIVDLGGLQTPTTINLQSRIYLSRNVTIQGSTNGIMTISGNNKTRIFFIQSGDVILANITLANGYGKAGDSAGSGGAAGMGGAIFQNGGNLFLRNVALVENQAVGGSGNTASTNFCSGFGGNVPNASFIHACAGDLGGAGTNLRLSPLLNAANGGDGESGSPSSFGNAGFGGFGGGGGDGPSGAGAGFGGGRGSSFALVGDQLGGYGGGSSHSILVQIPGTQFVASTAGAGAGFGGAIFERNGTLTLDSVIFQDNSAVAGISGMNNASSGQGKGGALFVYYGAKAKLNNVTFSNNTAADAGKPGIGNSAAPYVDGATCPGMDNVNICGPVTGISAQLDDTIQATTSGNAFKPLSAIISDENGNPAAGIDVTFTAPSAGASGVFSNLSNTITIQTDANGVATAPFTANGVPGPFVVTATTDSLTQTFSLVNSSQFIAAQTLGSVRNNYTGFVGLKFTVGPTPTTAYALGRFVVAGNTQNHLVKLVQANGADVPNGSVIVSTVGAPAGSFRYAALPSPVTLLANTSYFLVSQETTGGDQWYDYGRVTNLPIATVVGPTYTDSAGSYIAVTELPGRSYVPVSFIAAPPSTPLSVAITSPSANLTLYGKVPVVVSTTGPVTALQLQVEGSNQGSPLPVSANQGPTYTLTLDTASLKVGSHSLTVVASDATGNLVSSPPVRVTFSDALGGSIELVSAGSLGQLRNDYTGFVGLAFTTGSTPIIITSLGRFVAPGNSGTHSLKLATTNGTDVPGSSVSVSLSGANAGTFWYATLPGGPITLQPNMTYYLLSQEVAGGDLWYNYGSVTTSAAAKVVGPAYTDERGNVITLTVLPGQSYVPVSFLYRTTPFVDNTGTAFTISQTASAVRNNYTGFVGMTIHVGSNPLVLSALGRYVVSGNTGAHTLKLVQADGTDFPAGATSLFLNGATPNQYAYAELPVPALLSPNTTYYLVSQERAGGDLWYDFEPITTTGVAQVNGPTYTDENGKFVTVTVFPGNSYVPLSFRYR